jgi:hypothetical protein
MEPHQSCRNCLTFSDSDVEFCPYCGDRGVGSEGSRVPMSLRGRGQAIGVFIAGLLLASMGTCAAISSIGAPDDESYGMASAFALLCLLAMPFVYAWSIVLWKRRRE